MEATQEQTNAVEVFRGRITNLTIQPDYKIKSPEEAQAVSAQLKDIHQLGKDIEAAKKAELEPIAAAEKAVREKWKPVEVMAVNLKSAATGCLGDWQEREQRRIALERAEAERKAAAERAQAEALARKAREEAQRKAEEAAAKGQIEKAEAILHGAEQKAQAHEMAAAMAAPVAVTATKLEGVRTVETWTPKVDNLRQALTSLLADEFVDLSSLIDIKAAGLNKLASQYKDNLPKKYPGLSVQKQIKTAATGR